MNPSRWKKRGSLVREPLTLIISVILVFGALIGYVVEGKDVTSILLQLIGDESAIEEAQPSMPPQALTESPKR